MKRILLIISLLLWLESRPIIAEQSLPAGARFVSPNQHYSLELEKVDRMQQLVIKDMEDGSRDAVIPIATPLLYAHWGANSQSVVTVEHLAKGSYGRVIYLDAGKWVNVQIHPSGHEMKDYVVLQLAMRDGRVHYKFAVRRLTTNGTPLDYSFYDVDVNLATGEMFNSKRTPASQDEYVAALARRPEYNPPISDNRGG